MANTIPTLDWALREFSFGLSCFRRHGFRLVESVKSPRQFTVSVKLGGKQYTRGCEELAPLIEQASKKMAALLKNKGMTKLVEYPRQGASKRSDWSSLHAPSYQISTLAEQHEGFVNFKVLAA